MRMLLMFLLAMAWSSGARGLSGHGGIVLQSTTEQVAIGNFSYLKDASRKLEFESVKDREDWQTNERPNFNFGLAEEVYWIRFRLSNQEDVPLKWVLEMEYAPLDYVDLYIVSDKGVIHKAAGDRLPFEAREINYRTTNFMIDTAANQTLTLYLKINSESSLQGPINLWSPKRFVEKASNELVSFSIYVGLMLSMFVYNLFLFLSIRDRSYLFYVAYVFSYGYTITSLFGLIYQYLTTHAPVFSNRMVPISIALAVLFAILFAQEFLQLRRYSVALWRVFRLGVVWAVCAVIAALFNYRLGIKLASSLAMLSAPILLLAGIVCLRKGYRPALFFVLAFAAFLIGVTANQLITFGVLEPSFFAYYSVHIGSAVEMLLLSISLGDKIKYQQKEAHQRIKQLNEQLQDEHRKIVSLNEHLEAKVEEQTRDIRSMLANIRLGIFTIVDDGLIHKDYSSFLEHIFHRSGLTGMKAVDLLLAQSDADHDAISQISSILESTLGEPKLSFELNEGSLIRELKKKDADGRMTILELDWNPIINRRHVIEKILVTIRDVTQLRELQQVANSKKKELEFIAEIVPVSREQFTRFLNSVEKLIEENERLLAASTLKNLEALKIVLINMHTIKGTSRTLGLKKLTEVVHEAEHYGSLLQNGPMDWDHTRLAQDAAMIKETFAYYRYVHDRILERGSSRANVEVATTRVEAILQAMASYRNEPLTGAARNFFQKIDFMLCHAFYQPAQTVLGEIFTATRRLAKDLNKEQPVIAIEENSIFLTDEGADLLRNVFGHLIRNSMDHGIETKEERLAGGKPASGLLQVGFCEKDDAVEIVYSDDGRGLALPVIQEIALARGLVPSVDGLSQEELAALIFEPGFSTSQKVTEISGRGVGMSAIKSYLEKAGGCLELKLVPQPRKSDNGHAPFSIRIHLPARYYRAFPKSILENAQSPAA
ncbi:7TM diverse intracellular signaling domain-containing protein [Oligoflexus tunisiensis]|uniref:7TM diverse intracellular signaling domain-containing protein n=1 Tax=Oligoflexus tunisiensis TaxID=708132 RepID=UPI000ABCC9F4|nr:7TM diverse intracellular signaling domain-containing protein [Oligoflexus tunisiensis]